MYRAEIVGRPGKHVALKVLAEEFAEDSHHLKRIQKVSRYVRHVRHPAILKVRAAGDLSGHWSLVSEYVEGVTLGEVLEAEGPLPAPVALRVAEAVASALDAIQGATDSKGRALRLIHRDLKPSNLLVSPTGELKLLDFGVAHKNFDLRTATEGSGVYGSLPHLAPERAESNDRHPIDIHALGMTLAELLLGRIPLGSPSDRAEDHAERVRAIDADLAAQGLPVGVRTLLREATAYDPRRRPTAKIFCLVCRSLQAGLPEVALSTWARDVVGDLVSRRRSREGPLSGQTLEGAGVEESSSRVRAPAPSRGRSGTQAPARSISPEVSAGWDRTPDTVGRAQPMADMAPGGARSPAWARDSFVDDGEEGLEGPTRRKLQVELRKPGQGLQVARPKKVPPPEPPPRPRGGTPAPLVDRAATPATAAGGMSVSFTPAWEPGSGGPGADPSAPTVGAAAPLEEPLEEPSTVAPLSAMPVRFEPTEELGDPSTVIRKKEISLADEDTRDQAPSRSQSPAGGFLNLESVEDPSTVIRKKSDLSELMTQAEGPSPLRAPGLPSSFGDLSAIDNAHTEIRSPLDLPNAAETMELPPLRDEGPRQPTPYPPPPTRPLAPSLPPEAQEQPLWRRWWTTAAAMSVVGVAVAAILGGLSAFLGGTAVFGGILAGLVAASPEERCASNVEIGRAFVEEVKVRPRLQAHGLLDELEEECVAGRIGTWGTVLVIVELRNKGADGLLGEYEQEKVRREIQRWTE